MFAPEDRVSSPKMRLFWSLSSHTNTPLLCVGLLEINSLYLFHLIKWTANYQQIGPHIFQNTSVTSQLKGINSIHEINNWSPHIGRQMKKNIHQAGERDRNEGYLTCVELSVLPKFCQRGVWKDLWPNFATDKKRQHTLCVAWQEFLLRYFSKVQMLWGRTSAFYKQVPAMLPWQQGMI